MLAALAPPLEDDWKATLEAVAKAHRWASTVEPAELGTIVRALSDAYNAPNLTPGRAVASSAPALAARLGFSFPRDVPKAGAAVRELVASGELGVKTTTLRVLDLGAGLGATTWGIARALAAAGRTCTLDVTLTDEDAQALDVARELAKARGDVERRGEATVTLQVRAERLRASVEAGGRGPWDIILLGQVLSEMDGGVADEERVRRHAELANGLVGKLAPGGALVIVEPALCERTRHLHAVRDSVVTTGAASLFAPCLHSAPCPALQVPGDWCHEDLAIDLPSWLVPVAKAAGLRWQGLTFSYLVLRRRGERVLRDFLPRTIAQGRVVSSALVSKGKREHFLCGDLAAPGDPPLRARVSRLDREHSEKNAPWDSLGRGDLVGLEPAPDPKKMRIGRDGAVTVLSPEVPRPPGSA